MNIWQRRLLVLVSVGGGFTGAALSGALFFQRQPNVANYGIIFAMVAVFAYGIQAGLSFIEDELRGLRRLRWYFAMQMPIISSPYFAYQLSSGAALNLSWIDDRVWVFAHFGSEIAMVLLQPRPWGLGVNVVGLLLFLWSGYLIHVRTRLPESASAPPPVPEAASVAASAEATPPAAEPPAQ